MNLNKKFLSLCILIMMLLSVLCSSFYAASGYQGYAIYRDGVALNLNWHAGLMDEPYSTNYLPVTHAPGGSNVVKWGSWSEFLSGNNFKGVYRPKVSPSSTYRDYFASMGRNLITEQIPYVLTWQIDYDVYGQTGRTWVFPSDLTGMRCDGVVEYTYEYYGFRVYGDDTMWDITRWSNYNSGCHSITAIQPKSQAQNYLTLVTYNTP